MPGLLRGIARTAVVAGTATAVSNRVSRRQAGRWGRRIEQQRPAPYARAPAAGRHVPDPIEQLQQLGELRRRAC